MCTIMRIIFASFQKIIINKALSLISTINHTSKDQKDKMKDRPGKANQTATGAAAAATVVLGTRTLGRGRASERTKAS